MIQNESHIETVDIKRAKTEYPVMQLIRNRWSPRSFSEKKITEHDLHTLFEAASWAPSSRNEQPWQYLYAHHSDDEFKKFVDCLLPGNEPWAKHAAVLVISLSRKHFSNGKFNRTHMHDTGLANMQLVLQGLDLHIYTHMMAGFDMQKTREVFHVPEELEVICFIALGYLDGPEKLQEPYKTRESNTRTRNSLTDIVFKNRLK